MCFKIIPEIQSVYKTVSVEDTLVSEAIFSAYTDLKDKVTLKWNDFTTQMGYKIDVSDCFKDIIKMLDSIKNGIPAFTMDFPSQTFFQTWKFTRSGDLLLIEWLGMNEKYKITTSNKIEIESALFVNEWIKLLLKVRADLASVGYGKDNLEDFYLLENLERYL